MMIDLPDKIERLIININGIVQGVGFRPFVHNLAGSLDLKGWVQNCSNGVVIEVEGRTTDLDTFLTRLKNDAPPLAFIENCRVSHDEPAGYTGFSINGSTGEGVHNVYISPDISVCEDCLREMYDPKDRRYQYPFMNCTNCGPRFTITTGIPYDRVNTTMSGFNMCDECAREYNDPADRRFHAQPVACPKCGPALGLLSAEGHKLAVENVAQTARELLRQGKIIAIKGLGGYHLACDARNDGAVQELRRRKIRDGKPFALMARDVETVDRYCFASEKELSLLKSGRRPIVLLERKPGADLPVEFISSDNALLGVMLPYTPLHYLLFDQCDRDDRYDGCDGYIDVLVMTSGNRSGEPIYYKDSDAVEGLGSIADYFLVHNRDIHIRTDDPVTGVFRDREYIIRRSRGYVPFPIDISAACPGPATSMKDMAMGDASGKGTSVKDGLPHILACGGELKNTFCLAKGTKAFMSHHIGDLENLETLSSFEDGMEHFKRIFAAVPTVVAYDSHPEYLSTKYAENLEGIIKLKVQHHHAHIASCMAENGISGPVIGVAFDGTGYGDDGHIWGGEFFTGDYSGFHRQGHLGYVPLPGGEAAVREPWRMAVSYLLKYRGSDFGALADLPFLKAVAPMKIDIVRQQIAKGINSPLTSSAGRLFDAVSSLIGLCNTIEYEGQAAIRLQKAAEAAGTSQYPYEIIETKGNGVQVGYEIRVEKLFEAITADLAKGREIKEISGAFHRSMAGIILHMCRVLRAGEGIDRVVLSGGVFQNLLLLGLTVDLLEKDGFKVYTHSRVPANDGGISLGQAAIALSKYLEI